MKYLKISFICLFAYLFIGLFLPFKASAAPATQSATTNITVTVSGNTLSLSGYIAPFASVALTIDGNVIVSTAADAKGNFSFSNVAVPKATSTVCLDAVDFKKLGESEACITVTPVSGVISKTGVFLPPTMGVERTDVVVGSNAVAFGYGMPGAQITVHSNNATGCSVVADTSGYYQCSISIQKAGNYELFADSTLQGKPSEQQLKKILIKGITLAKPTPTPPLRGVGLPSFPELFAIPWWVWVLLVLIAIILIIILLRKYLPQAVPAIGIPSIGIPSIKLAHVFDFLFKKRKLHHHWMKGVGY